MKKTLSIYIFTYLLLTNLSFSQQNERKFNIHTIAFYNLENLFDTINDINKDDEKSPIMEIKYNRGEIYKIKLANMAKVISEIGTDEKSCRLAFSISKFKGVSSIKLSSLNISSL